MIRIYHGSDHIIQFPKYLGGKNDNDYGNGFYTTEYEDRAKSWAGLNGTPEKSVVNVYDLQFDNLNILDLNERGVLAWIAEVVANRGISEENAALVGERLVELYKPDTTRADMYARREVSKFLAERMKAILLDGFQVPGITARYAINNKLIYQGDGVYEQAGI